VNLYVYICGNKTAFDFDFMDGWMNDWMDGYIELNYAFRLVYLYDLDKHKFANNYG